MKEKKQCYVPEKRGKVGGQAVLEGVMMKSGDNVALTVRKEDGSTITKTSKFVSAKKKSAFFINFKLRESHKLFRLNIEHYVCEGVGLKIGAAKLRNFPLPCFFLDWCDFKHFLYPS